MQQFSEPCCPVPVTSPATVSNVGCGLSPLSGVWPSTQPSARALPVGVTGCVSRTYVDNASFPENSLDAGILVVKVEEGMKGFSGTNQGCVVSAGLKACVIFHLDKLMV